MAQCEICASLKSMEMEAILQGDLPKLRRVQGWIAKHQAEHERAELARRFAAVQAEREEVRR